VISTGAWIGSLFAKQRFARKVSMFAFIAAVLKILVYDLPGLSHVSRILILILLGIFLLIFSLFYAKIRRSSRRNAPGKQTVEES
jgi:VIT1/CCC1 family predicted Fe2+/Mn2+ transporter